MRRGVLAAALAAAALLAPAAPAGAALPTIKHVFVVILENEDAETTFAAKSPAPYLAQTLRAQGAFVPGYFGIGHESLDNYIGLVSGQGPNPYTQADAPAYAEFFPGLVTNADGQSIGTGSIYPATVSTVVNQLDAKGFTWRGYMEDMGKNPSRDAGTTCAHPASGSPDQTQKATPTDQYAMRHNPFMYFHSIIDNQAECDASVVPLSRLPGDLVATSTTPNYTFITPNLCHDGHDAPCADGEPGGLTSANLFLKQWVPKILASPAYADHGLLIVTLDESAHGAAACCGEKQGPNTPNNGGPDPGAGGGRVGAVLLSDFIKPGTLSNYQYNHYSLLRSVEDFFGLTHLGYAGAAGLKPFGTDVFTNPGGRHLPPVPRPTISLSKPPGGCVTHRFKLHVAATGARIRVTVKLDRRVIRRTGRHHLTVTIRAGRAKPGRHRVTAIATDRFGRRASRSRTFVRCGTG
jgi:hypothetical protein